MAQAIERYPIAKRNRLIVGRMFGIFYAGAL
jgi:hypothetical protein